MPSILEGSDLADAISCLYVVQIDRGRIKVGVTARPSSRIAQHRRLAEAHGCTPGPEWVSLRGCGTAANELALIQFCSSRAKQRIRSEYFAGVPFLVAVREAGRLSGDEEALKLLSRPRAAQAVTALSEARKAAGTLLPHLAAAAEERAAELRRTNPWIGRGVRCTEQEAAEWLGVTEDRIAELIAEGRFRRVPSRGRDRRMFIVTADIEELARRAS